MDLFKEKLKTKDISIAFPDFKDGQDVDKSKEFIMQKFLERNRHDPTRVYCTFTSATNSQMVKESIEMVKNTLITLRKKK
jgi:coenzyme F420-reducing hydrogenase delta subunit